ncbi:MAG: hypothetical protein WAK93_05385 [Solirubrobacteraceae bacterium]
MDALKAQEAEPPARENGEHGQPLTLATRGRMFVQAVRDGDESLATEAVLRLSQSRRALAPLAFVVGGIAMVFYGLKVLFSNWRLLLVQALPAMLIWLTMYDLKAHVLHGNSLPDIKGPVLIPLTLAIMAVTAASFFMNAVFGFAIVQPGRPLVRPAVEQAKRHLGIILGSGSAVGLMLALATLVVSRNHRPWFVLCLGVVIGLLMLCYVAIPSRLIGVKPAAPRRDRLTAAAVGGALGTVVCTPPYMLGRIGILMLGVRPLFIPGLIVLCFATAVQAGATGAVKTVKMTAKLLAGSPTSKAPDRA